jgi:hypothetical protein
MRKCTGTLVGAVVGAVRNEAVQFRMHDKRAGPNGGIEGAEFDNDPNTPQSAIPPVTMYTVPIVEVLDRFESPLVIDYLSLDVEGAAYFVIKGFTWNKYEIRIMTVERPKQVLVDLLYEHNYTSTWLPSTVLETKPYLLIPLT